MKYEQFEEPLAKIAKNLANRHAGTEHDELWWCIYRRAGQLLAAGGNLVEIMAQVEREFVGHA